MEEIEKTIKESVAVILGADGSVNLYLPKNRTDLTCELQDIVGGFFEIVGDGRHLIAFDEDGKAKGKPVNMRATVLAKAMEIIHPADCIVGDAVLCPAAMIP